MAGDVVILLIDGGAARARLEARCVNGFGVIGDRGILAEAAHIATEDARFYDLTLWNLAAGLSNIEQSPFVEFNDFMAMVVGVTKDDLDARMLLWNLS